MSTSDPRDAEISRLTRDLERATESLHLTEQALRFERQHAAFLFRTFVTRVQAPVVRPARSVLSRCADALLVMLAGPGRG